MGLTILKKYAECMNPYDEEDAGEDEITEIPEEREEEPEHEW